MSLPRAATWTLYVQYKRGKQIRKPKGIQGVVLSADVSVSHIYAFQGAENKGELFRYTVNFSRDGIMIEGFERPGFSRPTYLQRWWVMPEWGKEE